MESVCVNCIFWLRTESHGCIHYNDNGALSVMCKPRNVKKPLSDYQPLRKDTASRC